MTLLKVIIEKSRGGKFLWNRIEIWAGFGPVGITEKKNWADYEQHFSRLFQVFMAKKK